MGKPSVVAGVEDLGQTGVACAVGVFKATAVESLRPGQLAIFKVTNYLMQQFNSTLCPAS